MEDPQFFAQIPQTEMEVSSFMTRIPCFYRDMRVVAASFWAPLRALQAALPSDQLRPLRAGSRHGIATITAYETRDSDVGACSSVSIAIPVKTGDRATPGGIMRYRRRGGMVHSLHMQQSTEVAVVTSRDIFGFPALLADVQWDDHDTWLACRVNADDRHVLTLEGIRPSARSAHRRLHMQPITARQDRLVRCDLTIEILEGAVSMQPGTAKVVFGDHPLVDDLRTLELGRLASYQYAPRARAILGPPLESWPATTI
jgi:hypothetical protein